MNREVETLVRSAETQGWSVTKNNGHFHFQNPAGGDTIILASTPSDWRAHLNDVARLRKAGLQHKDKARDSHRAERIQREATRPGTQAGRILEVLQDHHGPLTPKEIAHKTGLGVTQVGASLQYLRSIHPEVKHVARGYWGWRPEPALAATSAITEAEAKAARAAARKVERAAARNGHSGNGHRTNGNGQHAAIQHIIDAPDMDDDTAERAVAAIEDTHKPTQVVVAERTPIQVVPRGLPDDLPSLFEAVSTDGKGNLVLRDPNGGHWLAVPFKAVLEP